MINIQLGKMAIQMPISFFFQADDGIRGHCVTGVQTCALPISWSNYQAGSTENKNWPSGHTYSDRYSSHRSKCGCENTKNYEHSGYSGSYGKPEYSGSYGKPEDRKSVV